jgi:hypothetical protein
MFSRKRHGQGEAAPRGRAVRRIAALGSALALTLGLSQVASAQEASTPDDAPPAGAHESTREPAVSFALGASLGFLQQQGLGAETQAKFIPGLLALAYVPVAPRLFLRPGVRLSYVGLTQTPSSFGARIEERGVQATAELGISYDAWLVPSLAVGGGANYRSIDFIGRGIVADSDAIDRVEWLGMVFAQAGLGLPLFRGALVVEPNLRLQHTFSDERALLQFGIDLTFAL